MFILNCDIHSKTSMGASHSTKDRPSLPLLPTQWILAELIAAAETPMMCLSEAWQEEQMQPRRTSRLCWPDKPSHMVSHQSEDQYPQRKAEMKSVNSAGPYLIHYDLKLVATSVFSTRHGASSNAVSHCGHSSYPHVCYFCFVLGGVWERDTKFWFQNYSDLVQVGL